MLRTLAAVTLSLAASCNAQENELIVIAPSTPSSLPPKMLVFVPGGGPDSENYEATVLAIQDSVEFPLWVSVIPFETRLCILEGTAAVQQKLDEAIAVARSQGYAGNAEEDIFIAGHSLGTTCALNYVDEYRPALGGFLSFAGLIDDTPEERGLDLTSFPMPILYAAGENNGGPARASRYAHWYRQFEAEYERRGDLALADKPVFILPEINHSDFCYPYFVSRDLPSGVEIEEAHKIIGEVSAAFLHLNTQQSREVQEEALAHFKDTLAFTDELMAPMKEMLDLEVTGGSGAVFPGAQTEWCRIAQETIAENVLDGVPDPAERWFVNSTYWPDIEGLQGSRTSWEFSPDGRMIVQTQGTNAYDIGSGAASEVGCKMLSPERVADELDLRQPDTELGCIDANKRALEIALEVIPERVLNKFKERNGREILFGADYDALAGPLFLALPLDYAITDTDVTITSPSIKTRIADLLFPGVTYCKMLSPARALDWYYTEGMRPSE